LDEDNETFSINLGSQDLVTIINSNIVATITDDDSEPIISINDIEADESEGSVLFTISLDAKSGREVRVDYATLDITTTVDSDYRPISGTFVFAPGTTTQQIALFIIEDDLDEADELAQLVLTNNINAVLSTTEGELLILDNDDSVSLNVNDTTASEHDGTLDFVFTLAKVSAQTVLVDYVSVSDSATQDTDYTGVSGTLTIAPGELSQTLSIVLNNDSDVEGTESFRLNLSNITNATINTTALTGTILDDDVVPSLTVADVAVSEVDDNLAFVFQLSEASGLSIQVVYATQEGTALDTIDYTGSTDTVIFAPGETSKTILIPILQDTIVEGTETFSLLLSNEQNATLTAASILATIYDDDVTPDIAISDATASELTGATLDFTVTLSEASGLVVNVNVATADITAVAGSDYSSVSNTITFPIGTTTQVVSVDVLTDDEGEITETLQADLSNPVNGAILDAQGIGTIWDDDATSIMDIAAPAGVVTEADGTTTFTVTLSEASGLTVTVDYTTVDDGTATADSDFMTNAGTLSFAPGEIAKTIIVSIIDDLDDEGSEDF
ncbi:hypothetical protein KAI87_17710, partial [Myxococcota bacterium]|nr:hypothetical protein [Myxococcota bacterium]